GVDYINRQDTQLCRFSECPVSGDDHLGFKVDNRTNFFIYTLDAAATATRSFSDELKGTTVLGVQYYQNIFDRNGASGRNLPPGRRVTAVRSARPWSSSSPSASGSS